MDSRLRGNDIKGSGNDIGKREWIAASDNHPHLNPPPQGGGEKTCNDRGMGRTEGILK